MTAGGVAKPVAPALPCRGPARHPAPRAAPPPAHRHQMPSATRRAHPDAPARPRPRADALAQAPSDPTHRSDPSPIRQRTTATDHVRRQRRIRRTRQTLQSGDPRIAPRSGQQHEARPEQLHRRNRRAIALQPHMRRTATRPRRRHILRHRIVDHRCRRTIRNHRPDSYAAPKISPCSLKNAARGSTAPSCRAVRPIDNEFSRLACVIAIPVGCRSA